MTNGPKYPYLTNQKILLLEEELTGNESLFYLASGHI